MKQVECGFCGCMTNAGAPCTTCTDQTMVNFLNDWTNCASCGTITNDSNMCSDCLRDADLPIDPDEWQWKEWADVDNGISMDDIPF